MAKPKVVFTFTEAGMGHIMPLKNIADSFESKYGDKVKVSIRFRGREMAHSKLGLDVMERFGQAIEGGTIEKPAKLEGRNMLMFIAPAHNK